MGRRQQAILRNHSLVLREQVVAVVLSRLDGGVNERSSLVGIDADQTGMMIGLIQQFPASILQC